MRLKLLRKVVYFFMLGLLLGGLFGVLFLSTLVSGSGALLPVCTENSLSRNVSS